MHTSSPLWSICTLTIQGRENSLSKLKDEVSIQIQDKSIEHVILPGTEKYGIKMRKASEISKGKYISYVDDDDDIEENYIEEIYNVLTNSSTPLDVITFGSYTPGHIPCWLRSNREDNSGTPEEGNVKTANHYCCWNRELAMSSVWLPRNYGAELIWYNLLLVAYPSLREHHIHKCLHIYKFDWNGTKCQDKKSIRDSLANGGTRILLYRHKDGRLLAGSEVRKLYQPDGRVVSEKEGNLTLLREIKFRY